VRILSLGALSVTAATMAALTCSVAGEDVNEVLKVLG
jgi:hypothetical protein